VIPEIYIIRLYRRLPQQLQRIAGLVETPNGSRCASFASLAELTAILGAPRTHLRRVASGKTAPAGMPARVPMAQLPDGLDARATHEPEVSASAAIGDGGGLDVLRLVDAERAAVGDDPRVGSK